MRATGNVVTFFYTADPIPGPGPVDPEPAPIIPGPGPGPVDPGPVVEAETTPPEITPAIDVAPFYQPEPDIPLAQPDPIIPDVQQVPFVAPLIYTGSWALWNLILSIAGAILALMIGIRVLIKKRQEEHEDIENTGLSDIRTSDEYAEDEKQNRSRLLLILAIPILAIVGCFLFFLTQDMRLPMTMIDRWTLAHGILLVGGIISYILAYRQDKDEDSDDEQQIKQTGAV